MFIEKDHLKITCQNFSQNPYDFLRELRILGFKKEADSYSLFYYEQGKEVSEIIMKIQKLGSQHNVSIELSSDLQIELEDNENASKLINETKAQLKRFKGGNIDQDLLDKHKFKVDSGDRNKNCKLLPHQEIASFHHYYAKNAANFSVPGSGKTIAVYATYHRLKLEKKVDSLFMIGPLTSFIAWKKDFEFFFGRSPQVKEFRGGQRSERKKSYRDDTPYDLYLSTFQTVANDFKEIPNLLKKKKILLVLDEAHYIKQQGGEWAQAILNFCQKAEYRIALTGTPMPQAYEDLFNIFDFLYPRYPILSGKDKLKIRDFQANENDVEAQQILNDTIYPFFYRVKKKDLGLKAQNIEKINIRMNNEERFIYDAVKNKILQDNAEEAFQNITILTRLWKARIIRLRQIFSYCALLNNALDIKEDEDDVIKRLPILQDKITNYVETPAKLYELMNIVKNHMKKGDKILIWSNFLGTIDLISTHIRNENFYLEKITGATPNPSAEDNEKINNDELTRAEIAQRFNNEDDNLRILIANPASCAESISLHKACNHAIYYDLDYNCSKYLQSLDRIHRVGASEKRDSNYYILQYEDTVEGKILKSLQRKADRMIKIIESEYPLTLNEFDDKDELINIFKDE